MLAVTLAIRRDPVCSGASATLPIKLQTMIDTPNGFEKQRPVC